MLITVLVTIAKTWRQPKCPSTEKWIQKTWSIDTKEYPSAVKGMKCAICRDPDGPRDCHTE